MKEEGHAQSEGYFRARAYMKYKSSTLHGFASYENGKIYGLGWNETSDLRMVYPYVTADAIGGDMKMERYNFGGGYADHRNRWDWGVRLSYLAGLYYRNVDPRPKNITGLFDIEAAAGYEILEGYHLGLSAAYERYTQSNDIKFVSEMGESKIYHLTGMGTHYVRFAGNGKSSHYQGNAFRGKISINPGLNDGFIISALYRHYAFKKIFDDLNRLPLARASEDAFRVEIGWRSRGDAEGLSSNAPQSTIAMKVVTGMSKRTGFENIFGDAASSIYPLIGTQEKFHATMREAGASVMWQLADGPSRSIAVEAEVSGNRLHRNYIDPVRIHTINAVDALLKVKGNIPLPWKLNLSGEITGTYHAPFKSFLYIDSKRLTDDAGATDSFLHETALMDLNYGEGNASVSLLRPISRRFALDITGGYGIRLYQGDLKRQQWHIALSLIF